MLHKDKVELRTAKIYGLAIVILMIALWAVYNGSVDYPTPVLR
jgi:hypothetical protein